MPGEYKMSSDLERNPIVFSLRVRSGNHEWIPRDFFNMFRSVTVSPV